MSFVRHVILAVWAASAWAFSVAQAAVQIQNVHLTNVGTTTFTAVWTTSEVAQPAVDVFSDSEGTQPVHASLALEFFPLHEGDAAAPGTAGTRAARRALQDLVKSRQVAVVRVSGLTPDTTYFVRPRSLAENGVDNTVALVPLQPVTTAAFTGLVPEARLLRVRFPAVAAEGMVALVQGPATTLPLSMVVGDSGNADTALISLANLIDAATGTNAVLTGPQTFTIRLLGLGAPAGVFTEVLTLTNEFRVAGLESIEAELSSPAPLFVAQPSDVAAIAGGVATFTVEAVGDPAPSYQWQRKAAGSALWMDLLDGGAYAGSTAATLTIDPLALGMNGDQFRARASNGTLPDALSDAAVLTVTTAPTAPVVTSAPEAATVLVGQTAIFSVVATGNPVPTYQWQRRAAGSDTWADLADGGTYLGALTATLSITDASLAMNGDQFRVVVSNGLPPDVTTAGVPLTVQAAAVPPSFLAQPQPQTVPLGQPATFTVEASGTPAPAIQWQRRAAAGETWVDLLEGQTYVGVTTSSLTVSATTAVMSGDRFRAIASNGTLPNATSEEALLTVQLPPVITNQPLPATVPAGANASFTVAATGTGELSYQWERRAAGALVWLPLIEGGGFSGVTTTQLQVAGVTAALHQDAFRCVVTDTIGSTASDGALLQVTKATAAITLSELRQLYDGTAKTVGATTEPAGLNVTITYNGNADAPVYPGTYAVEATIDDGDYTGSITGELTIDVGVVVRRAPTLAGGVEGSLQVLSGETFTVTGWLARDLLVAGEPTVVSNDNPAFAGVQNAAGASSPSNYTVTVAAPAALRYVVRRVDAVTLPTVTAPNAPTGTRNVSLTTPGQNAGDFSTIRNLTLGGSAGDVVVPAGAYGNLTANGKSAFVLGVAGATEPAVYHLQNLSINPLRQGATLKVVGPVIVTVAGTVALYGNAGDAEHPEWLTIQSPSGTIGLNLATVLHGYVVNPGGLVNVAGTSTLRGGVITDRLTVASGAEIEEIAR